uniref:Uncharacterized protein n=1 Tax=Arundo donax TaxID=35708 RepID=A0A0A9DL21_ARUDO
MDVSQCATTVQFSQSPDCAVR